MIAVKVVPKKWGNSIGIRLPKDKIKNADIKPEKETIIWLEERKGSTLESLFGALKGRKINAQRMKDESRKIWDM